MITAYSFTEFMITCCETAASRKGPSTSSTCLTCAPVASLVRKRVLTSNGVFGLYNSAGYFLRHLANRINLVPLQPHIQITALKILVLTRSKRRIRIRTRAINPLFRAYALRPSIA